MTRQQIAFDGFKLDLDRSALIGPAGELPLRPKSFEVLRHLLLHGGRVVAKSELMQAVWPDVMVGDESLAQCISEIRRALGGDGLRIVRTVPKRGYMVDVAIQDGSLAAAADAPDAPRETDASLAAPSSRHKDRSSIAVLPFETVAGAAGSETDDFADGLCEDVTAGLSHIRALLVISYSTMSGYKGRSIDVRAIGHDLDVSYVLSGRVRQSGQRVRVTTLMTETSSGRQVWAAKFDRALVDWFELQDDLTQCIVASVQVQVIVNEGRATERHAHRSARPVNVLARSREKLYLATADGLSEVVAAAERALAADPGNGLACQLLSAALWHQIYRGYSPWSADTVGRIMETAERAVLAADADEYAHWAIALAHLMHGQHDRALVALRQTLDINPSFSLAFGTLGTVLAWAGEPELSIENNLLALRLNPGDPLNPHRYFGLALAHYLAHRYSAALENANRAVGVRPDWWLAHMALAVALAQLGRLAEARAACSDLLRLKPDLTLKSLDVLPFAKESDHQHVADGLRRCGVPAG
jgi:adenylate cyclase